MRIEAWKVKKGDYIDGSMVKNIDTTCVNEWIEFHFLLESGAVVSAGYYEKIYVGVQLEFDNV
jgi:hypothetical protein